MAAFSAAIASCKTGGIRRTSLSSSNHASSSGLHNLAHRSSLAPACGLQTATHGQTPASPSDSTLCRIFPPTAGSPAGDEALSDLRGCSHHEATEWRNAQSVFSLGTLPACFRLAA
ncbi:hypothetical protein COCVIDRAFT_34774 [Bipolaris victoriae FI3]|uniref:Uncharacterized protein n=1 Tax=Bipolaris victoriae (strain FI3) TaxID=930091 RepID=W7F3C3_BIPV3|nr:hypothetical protein COCVIDRAFT_34774 [Bipolaris victoriae FI3]